MPLSLFRVEGPPPDALVRAPLMAGVRVFNVRIHQHHIKLIDVIFLLGWHSIIIDIDVVHSWPSIQRQADSNIISNWLYRPCLFLFKFKHNRINIRRNVVNFQVWPNDGE